MIKLTSKQLDQILTNKEHFTIINDIIDRYLIELNNNSLMINDTNSLYKNRGIALGLQELKEVINYKNRNK